MVQGRITEAYTPTIWLSTTPFGLISAHLHHPPIFMLDDLPAATPLPLYPGLGQAPNMPDCIPSGVVSFSTFTSFGQIIYRCAFVIKLYTSQ